MGDRCTGDCCRAFTLSITYGELLRGYDSWRFGGRTCIRHGGGQRGIPTDVHLVAPMIRPLGEFTKNPVSGAVFDQPTQLYTCVHLTTNSDCGIYDRRPDICRIYPNGRKCHFPGCTWDHVKTLPES